MDIAPLTPQYLDAVLAIEELSFPRPWRREHFLDELASPHAVALVALAKEGTLLGYISARIVAGEGEILDVAVAPDARRQGVAQRLINAVMELCQQRQAMVLHLEVRLSNEAAIALYHHLGFVDGALRKRYYENGEDALLMSCQLSSTRADG
jgi:ribosomal-protein-alanine N-acetyltransferase